LAARCRIPLSEYQARRVALIKPSALGDIVHTLPVLTALRRRFPHAHLAWVVNRSYEPLLRGHPDLDATLPFDRGASRTGIWRGFQSYAEFARRFRREQFDLVIDLQGLLRSGLMARASRAPRLVGLSSAREGATWFYTDLIPVADYNALHAVDRYWLVADALGVGNVPKQFHVHIPATDRLWAFEQLRNLPRPWLMLGVGSRWITKRWPPDHFAELARQSQARFGGSAIFVGNRDDTDLANETANQLSGPALVLTGKTTLPQLAAVLKQADVMLANDTGPLHLAAALGRPVVAPYTCTKVRRNGPYAQDAHAVESRVWCQGSYLKRCPRLECMAELGPDRLWPILEGVLRQWQARDRSA
jgi:lipopolysaccharide heptosyltransferase I